MSMRVHDDPGQFVARREGDTPARAAGTPLSLLRCGASLLPRRLVSAATAAIMQSLAKTHPRLLTGLASLDAAVVHVLPSDLPYGFALAVGVSPPVLTLVGADAGGADASVRASVATLVDLLEGRIDSDSLFFRRDLTVSGNTGVIVGLRNLIDREVLDLGDEIAAALGPLARPSRALARLLDRLLLRIGVRVAAMHRTLHPHAERSQEVAGAELERCRSEIEALTARIGTLEARQQRRDDKLGQGIA